LNACDRRKMGHRRNKTRRNGGFSRFSIWSEVPIVAVHKCESAPIVEISFISEATNRSRNVNPVINVIEERLRENSKPQARTDGHKVCLAIEGGGMRGCVSAGMVAALHELGVFDALDGVYGSSAGAINGAYFVSNQTDKASMYHDKLPGDSKFISLKRLFIGKPAMSVEYLVDDILRKNPVYALDWQRVLASPVPLKAIASSLTQQRSVILDCSKSQDELLKSLRATCQVPILAGKPFKWNDEEYVDGALFEPIPIHSAVADGCTHVLTLLTRPAGSTCKDGKTDPFKLFWARRFIPDWLTRLYEKGHLHSDDHYMQDVELLQNASATTTTSSSSEVTSAITLPKHLWTCAATTNANGSSDERRAHFFGLAPTSINIGTMEMDAKRLKAGVQAGRDVVFSCLGHLSSIREESALPSVTVSLLPFTPPEPKTILVSSKNSSSSRRRRWRGRLLSDHAVTTQPQPPQAQTVITANAQNAPAEPTSVSEQKALFKSLSSYMK